MKILFLVFISLYSFADFTLNNNISAGFKQNEVKVFFTSNSTCANASVSAQEMLMIISDAVNQYWNIVPTSRLRLVNGGILQTSDANYLTGDLCNPDLETCEAQVLPKASDIVIACNSNTTSDNNFKPVGGNPTKKIAVALPNNFSSNNIQGAVIIINDTADTPFDTLDYSSRVAVIAHEIGHAIGLGHSNNSSALMYYRVQDIRHSLGPDDFAGVTYLYPVKVDGCGILSVRDINSKDDGDHPWNFLLSLFFGIVLISMLKKLYTYLKLVPSFWHLRS